MRSVRNFAVFFLIFSKHDKHHLIIQMINIIKWMTQEVTMRNLLEYLINRQTSRCGLIIIFLGVCLNIQDVHVLATNSSWKASNSYNVLCSPHRFLFVNWGYIMFMIYNSSRIRYQHLPFTRCGISDYIFFIQTSLSEPHDVLELSLIKIGINEVLENITFNSISM